MSSENSVPPETAAAQVGAPINKTLLNDFGSFLVDLLDVDDKAVPKANALALEKVVDKIRQEEAAKLEQHLHCIHTLMQSEAKVIRDCRAKMKNAKAQIDALQQRATDIVAGKIRLEDPTVLPNGGGTITGNVGQPIYLADQAAPSLRIDPAPRRSHDVCLVTSCPSRSRSPGHAATACNLTGSCPSWKY